MRTRLTWTSMVVVAGWGLFLLAGCSRHGFDARESLVIYAVDPHGPLADITMWVGESLELRALAVEEGGQVQDEVPVSWILVGNGFPQSDLSWEPPESARAVLRPSTQGLLTVHATYSGDDPVLDPASASTGLIQVTEVTSPARLVGLSGDAQTGVVGGLLPEPLVVKVQDQSGLPVMGALVEFLVVQGDGSVEGESRVTCDSEGRAAAQVRLGTGVGEFSQMFRVQLDSNPSLYADFVASTLPGAPCQLRFLTQPGEALAGLPFGQQPVVAMLDEYQNQTTASDPVSLEVASGTGNLTGTTTVDMQAGVATFTDIGYDSEDSSVILRATSGAFQVDSQAFDVGEGIPGQCLNQDDLFITSEGGCMHLESSLVWSSRSPEMSWSDLAWDASLPGAFQPDAGDYGRTNDLSEENLSLCGAICDDTITSYCHTLDEGGYTDWRLPSRDELILLAAGMLAGSPPYLAGVTPDPVFSSTNLVGSNKHCVDLVNGTDEACAHYFSHSTYCVRGGRQAPDHLEVLSGQGSLGSGYPAGELAVAVRESDGSQVNSEGVRVRIESADLGTLGGNLEAFSDKGGIARITGWTLDTQGSVTLTISAESLAPATHTLRVGAYPHTCLLEDDQFQTAEGGCKHSLTGLVWSQAAPDQRDWHEAVWDSASPPGNAPPDADDAGRLNDYDNDPGACPDDSLQNYCHELEEGGYHDWRMPTVQELNNACDFGQGAGIHFGFDTDRFFHSSTTCSPNSFWMRTFNLHTGDGHGDNKVQRYWVVCVRQGS